MMALVVRTQIRLTEDQHSALRRLSVDTGRSVADLIRAAVGQALSSAPLLARRDRLERARHLAEAFRK